MLAIKDVFFIKDVLLIKFGAHHPRMDLKIGSTGMGATIWDCCGWKGHLRLGPWQGSQVTLVLCPADAFCEGLLYLVLGAPKALEKVQEPRRRRIWRSFHLPKSKM